VPPAQRTGPDLEALSPVGLAERVLAARRPSDFGLALRDAVGRLERRRQLGRAQVALRTVSKVVQAGRVGVASAVGYLASAGLNR
jgi:hypothetical protein